MQQLIKNLTGLEKIKVGLYHFLKNDEVAIIGVYEENEVFQGSDRLSMSVMKDNNLVMDVFSKIEFVIAEGDRFTNSTFIEKFKPIVLKIQGNGSYGRKIRCSNQTERHIKSIATRVDNIQADIEFANSGDCFRYLLNEIKKTGIDLQLGIEPAIKDKQQYLKF